MLARQSIALLVLASPLCLGWSSTASAQSVDKITASKSQDLLDQKAQEQQRNLVVIESECFTKVAYRFRCLSFHKIDSKPNLNFSLQTTFNSPRLVAQTPPPSIPSRILEPTRPVNQQLPDSLINTQPTTPTLTPLFNPTQPVRFRPKSLVEEKIPVKRVEVLGSTAFSPAQLDKVIAPFINKALTFGELLKIRTALTNLYINNGYRTSGAFLPPQDTSNGIVKIQVVEGKLEKVEIQGLKRLKESYVRSRIGIPPNTPLNIRELEKALQLLQVDPLFSRVQAELMAGSTPGRSVMMLTLVELRPISSAVVIDNQDSPSVGSTGVTGILSYNNLLGLGDRLGAEVGYTGGVNSYNLNYEVPVNSSNGTLSFRYNNGRNRVIEEPFAPLDIKGRAQSYSLGFRQPINRTPNSEFTLGLSADLRRSQTFLFDDEPFSFSPGAEEGESKVTAIRFSQDWVNRDSKRILAARSQFSFGLGLLGATINNNEADGRFFSWVGQAQLVQALNEKKDFVFVARAAAQLTPDSLLPLEQFSIGGVDTVRGYRTTPGIIR